MLNAANLISCLNYNGSVQGKWTTPANWNWIVDPLNGEKFIKIAEVQGTEIKVWLEMLLLYVPCYSQP
jgi:hypothetical protein